MWPVQGEYPIILYYRLIDCIFETIVYYYKSWYLPSASTIWSVGAANTIWIIASYYDIGSKVYERT